jgi:two-component system, sensor histidine kinase and response regulator
MSDDPVLDAATLERLRALNEEGEPDFVVEVLTLFLADTTPRLVAMTEALASGDGRSLERTAHAVKGAAANIGAHRLRGACERLEAIGRDGRMAEAAAAVNAVIVECDVLRVEIHTVLGR